MVIQRMIFVLFVGASIILGQNSPPINGAIDGMVVVPVGTFDMGSVKGENSLGTIGFKIISDTQ